MCVILSTGGSNETGANWYTASPETPRFNTPLNNPCYRWKDAPEGKQFRIFSINGFMQTITLVQDDPTQPSSCNLNIYVQHVPKARIYGSLSGWGYLFYARVFQEKLGSGGLVHDANGDSSYDAATDHRNPMNFTEKRWYNPEPHFIYPHGIDVGPHLCFIVQFGGHQNGGYFNGSMPVNWIVEYALVPSKKYRKVFHR